jgi:hypothetical protein
MINDDVSIQVAEIRSILIHTEQTLSNNADLTQQTYGGYLGQLMRSIVPDIIGDNIFYYNHDLLWVDFEEYGYFDEVDIVLEGGSVDVGVLRKNENETHIENDVLDLDEGLKIKFSGFHLNEFLGANSFDRILLVGFVLFNSSNKRLRGRYVILPFSKSRFVIADLPRLNSSKSLLYRNALFAEEWVNILRDQHNGRKEISGAGHSIIIQTIWSKYKNVNGTEEICNDAKLLKLHYTVRSNSADLCRESEYFIHHDEDYLQDIDLISLGLDIDDFKWSGLEITPVLNEFFYDLIDIEFIVGVNPLDQFEKLEKLIEDMGGFVPNKSFQKFCVLESGNRFLNERDIAPCSSIGELHQKILGSENRQIDSLIDYQRLELIEDVFWMLNSLKKVQ